MAAAFAPSTALDTRTCSSHFVCAPPRQLVKRATLHIARACEEGSSTAVSQDRNTACLRVLPALALLTLSSPAAAGEAAVGQAQDNGWLSPIVDSLDLVLGTIEGFYASVGLPYAYGWSIVSLTAFVKLLTLPLTKKQVESAMSVQALKPRVDVIKERYGEDKKKIQKETSRLYEQAGVNPLAGCLPSLLQLPIFIGLYRSLNNVALSGSLDNEGFFWIPSLAGARPSTYRGAALAPVIVSCVRFRALATKLCARHGRQGYKGPWKPPAGPVSAAARMDGGATAWLFPFVDGAPPIGWSEASLYLVLPVLLLVAQYASTAIISPVDPNDEQATTQRALIYLLPLTIGYFSLTVPSGLSLYYFANSIFTSAQQIYFRKLGGATVDTPDLGPVTKLGMGRRTGPVVEVPKAAAALPGLEGNGTSLAAEFGGGAALPTPTGQNGSAADAPRAAPEGSGAAAAGSESRATPEDGSDAQGDDSEGDSVVGGLMLDEQLMDGVAEQELEYLRSRSKRKRRSAVAI